jgi:anti-sigma factor RsiW
MRLFSFDDPVHREANLLLPWYLNGTLQGTERARVDRHVRECVACKSELEAQTRLQELVGTEDPHPEATAALARLHARMAAQPGPAGGSVLPRRAHHRRGATRDANGVRRWWERHRWLTLGLGAQFLVVLTLIVLWQRPEPATFHTLGSSPASAISRDAVVVIFDSTASQERISKLLRELDARIVDGPNSHDAYTLDVPVGSQTEVLEALRRRPWVRFAQPAPGSRGTRP